MTDLFFKSFFLLCVSLSFLTACRDARKIDLRKLAPRETIVYLETNDSAALLDALTASPAFQTLADAKDFSALRNVQMAVAVVGFETSEQDSTLNLKPRFVAVVETRAWHWQAVSLVENQLDGFVVKNYGAAAKYEKTEKDGGDFFTWTAEDSRRVFAFVKDGSIYFGNDQAAIEKCSALKNGAGENLTQNESFASAYSENNLAFGYVSTDGVRQIAALAGVSVAVNASEEADERSFIARALPPILENTTEEIVWTANRASVGIEDKFAVRLKPETAAILNETLIAGGVAPEDALAFLPPDVYSATRYDLKNPLAAWRGSVSLAARSADVLSAKILNDYSDKLLEPYGVGAAENFTASIAAPIITAQFDAAGEQSVTLATVADAARLKSSIAPEINFKSPPEKKFDAEIWFSQDRNLAAAFVENKIVLGDGETVLKCLARRQAAGKSPNVPAFQRFVAGRQAVAATFGTDFDSAEKIVGILGDAKNANLKLATFYTVETRPTAEGFERRSVSDFGFAGTILKNLN